MTTDWNKIAALAAVMGVTGGFLAFIGRIAWLALGVFQEMRTSLHVIATNDLPHIYAEIRELKHEFLNRIGGVNGSDKTGNTRGD